MVSYQNLGPQYRGSGQTIAIFDTGVEKAHPFLQNKVTVEACFSTNTAPYASLCPSPNGNGDSPLGLSNSAVPSATCRAIANCFHGTHVAGIAAGKNWNGLNGMAPDANIMAVQVFSYVPETNVLSSAKADIAAAADALANNISAGGGGYTVNISIGTTNAYLPKCPAATNPGLPQAFEDAVSKLVSLRVPVVVSTGNEGFVNQLAWPACTPKVIKVGATIRDAAFQFPADRFWPRSNSATPLSDHLIGEIELLAPGSYISSSKLLVNGVAATTQLAEQGTSMAAPHVAGLYAALKSAFPGITVANASAWIMGSASIWTDAAGGYQIKRIHLP